MPEQKWFYLYYSWETVGFNTFPKGISPKVNIITGLDFEFAYFKAGVQYFSHYTMGTSHAFTSVDKCIYKQDKFR